MKAVSLQCNYRVNPLGIDDMTPRLSWICQGGKKQSAYQIEIPSNTEAELTLPDGTQRILSCGSYSYLLKPIPDQKQ